MLQKNQIIPLAIHDLSYEGNGVGHWEDAPVFVSGAVPGDTIRARIVKTCASYAYGIVEELTIPSSNRAQNDCPVFPRCGGCTLRHIDYRAECEYKDKWVADNLRRIGGVHFPMEPLLPSPLAGRYRNKAQFPIRMVNGRIATGYFAPRSHRLIPVDDCRLQPEHFAALARTFLAVAEEVGLTAYDEETNQGLLRHLYIRYAETTKDTLVCVVANGSRLPAEKQFAKSLEEVCPGALSLHLGINRERTNVILNGQTRHLSGPPHICDTLCGITLRLSPESFYQVNRTAAEALYHIAADYASLQPGEALLDLYCGIGSIGLSMAAKAGSVIGVETVPGAVEDAVANAAENGIKNASFLCMDAEEAAKTLKEKKTKPDVVILDPPRKGASPGTLRLIAEMGPSRIVYISCNSATLARDLALLKELGYRAVRGRAVDLFPRTNHVETVVLLLKD